MPFGQRSVSFFGQQIQMTMSYAFLKKVCFFESKANCVPFLYQRLSLRKKIRQKMLCAFFSSKFVFFAK
jgi:hypothetical protein